MDKKVSIIIPCYKQADFIVDAVEVALQQTYKNLEIVCVNDASPDNTLEILKQLDEKYDKVKIVDLKENGGLAHARNAGIEAAKGEYILPLDADDKIDSTYIEKAVKILDKKPQIGMVYCDAEFFGAKQGKWELPEFNKETFIYQNCVFCTALFRKSDWLRAGKYNETMRTAWEDWDFWLSFIELGLEPYKIPETMFFYRKHNNQSMIDKVAGIEQKLWKQIACNHPKLYLSNDKIIRGIFDPHNTPECKQIHKKYRKYKKLYDFFMNLFVIETILFAVYIIYNLAVK